MKKKNIFIILGAIFLILLIYLVVSGEKVAGEQIIVYKSASCGCCVQYIPYLERQGFDVKTIIKEDMQAIKENYGVPGSMESCHTVIIGDYFVEGHVPIKAINKLITEQPNIDGIALPGMPAGSPGMPGIKRGDFVIKSVSNGEVSEFMRI